MKGLSAIALFSVVLVLSACGSSDNGSGDKAIPDEVFSEQSPLTFAQNYVKYVQGGASKQVYGQFLHPGAREKLNAGSEMADFMYQSALRENAVITDRAVLNEDAKRTEDGNKISLRFYFDKEIDFKNVYPHSPFADEGYVIKSGQINLRKDNDRWGINGHSLDGE